MKKMKNNKTIDIRKLEREIVNRLKPLNPEIIILFGSYAYGDPDENSDIDIYIATSDEFVPKNWKELSELYLKYSKLIRDLQKDIPIDLIVHTKKMYKKFVKYNKSFANEISKGKILWQRS